MGELPCPGVIKPWHHCDRTRVRCSPSRGRPRCFAIADALLRRGLFTAADWASALGAALAEADHHGAPDTPATYYRSALVALEQLLAQHAPEISRLMPDRISAWRRAHLDTPHGEPVVRAADRAPPISR